MAGGADDHLGMDVDSDLAQAGPSSDSIRLDERTKQLFIELQRHWLEDYKLSRERVMVELTEKMHQEYLADHQKIRADLLTKFKDELDGVKQELDIKYKEHLDFQLSKINEEHRRNLQNVKKKQWCWSCSNEAIYHCCWNTAYCSTECQQGHWPTHRKYCRRRRPAQ